MEGDQGKWSQMKKSGRSWKQMKANDYNFRLMKVDEAKGR